MFYVTVHYRLDTSGTAKHSWTSRCGTRGGWTDLLVLKHSDASSQRLFTTVADPSASNVLDAWGDANTELRDMLVASGVTAYELTIDSVSMVRARP